MWQLLKIRLLILSLASGTLALAQQPASTGEKSRISADILSPSAEPLHVKLVRHKVVLIDGKESLQSAATAKPGDILEEVATYSNRSKAPLKGLEATLPIPANTELLINSVEPGNAKASTDGILFFAMPLKRKIKQENDREVESPVPISEYRYLRWYTGELAEGKTLMFSVRVKVSNDNNIANLAPGK